MKKKFSVQFVVEIIDGGVDRHENEIDYKGKKPSISEISPEKIIKNYNEHAYDDEYFSFMKPTIKHIKGNKFELHTYFKPKSLRSFEDARSQIETYIDFDDDGNYPLIYNNHSFLIKGIVKPPLKEMLNQGKRNILSI